MKGKGKTAGKGRAGARAPLALAAAALAAALVFTVSYAYARYATEYALDAEVACFSVTGEFGYVDEWGTARSIDGGLGTMMPKESEGERTIEFTFTVHNRSEVDVNCYLTLSGDYVLSFEAVELTEEEKEGYGTYTIPEDDSKTLYMEETVEAGSYSKPVTFLVVVGDYAGYTEGADGLDATEKGVYSGVLNIRADYVQAS